MRLSLKRAAFAVGAAATVVAVGAATASAVAPNFTVTIGSATSGSGTYTAVSTIVSPATNASVKLTDTSTGIAVTCTSAAAAGSIPTLGTGLGSSGTPPTRLLATITSTTWTSCTGAGLTFSVSQVGTWSINGSGPATGGVVGNLSGVSAHLSATGCTFDVTGSTDGTYTNTGQILAVKPVAGSGHVLTISNVVGCFGAVGNAHTASFVGNYAVSAKTSAGVAGALTITSP